MANLVRLNGGLKPVGVLRRANIYNSGGTVYPGDPVSLNSSGQVTYASAGSPLVGVALSYASSGSDLLVADHPDQEFSVPCSVSAGVASQTAMNLNYNIISGAGNSTYKLSGATLDDSSGTVISTSVTNQLKALRIEQSPKNAFGANAEVVVIINNHSLKGSTGTTGV